MTTDHLTANDGETLRGASLFRKIRALTRAMRKGTEWRLDCDTIRHGDQCPLTFVGSLHGMPAMNGSNPIAAHEAAKRIGLRDWSRNIMGAADASYVAKFVTRRKLRRVLIRAAGLKDSSR